MAWSAKPKGDRAAILELEARCTGVGAGRRTPTVFRVPALYKDGWAGPVTRPRSRSVEPSAGSRRSLRRSSRSGTLSPLPDRAESRTSFQHGNWFASSLSDLESHWDDRTIFGIDKRHEQNRPEPVTIDPTEDAAPVARTENRDSFPRLDPSELPPRALPKGLLRDKITMMRETCLRGNQTVMGVIQLPPPAGGPTYAHAQ